MRAAVKRVAEKWGFDTGKLRAAGVLEQVAMIAAELKEKGAGFRQEAERVIVAIEAQAAEAAQLVSGAPEALEDLRERGFAIALITRNCRAAAEVVLRHLRAYDVLLTRDDVPRPKPDPDHVHRSLVAIGRTPNRTAMVGDHPYDMRAGRAAGLCLCIGVRTGHSPDVSLLDAGADVVMDSIADLPSWLRERGKGHR